MHARLSYVLTILLAVVLAGCLPYSCRRTEPTALFPSDSLSQRIAAGVPADTLTMIQQSSGAEDRPMGYPTSLLRGPEQRFFASDAKENSIYVFDSAGTFQRRVEAPSFSYPFLAGFRGDTLLVLNRGSSTIDFVLNDRVVNSLSVPEGAGAMAVTTSNGIYYKTVGEDNWFSPDVTGYIARLTRSGDTTSPRVELPGPYWRHRGFLRTWGDTLVSLSGYRPVVDMVLPGGEFDTLTLRGFDSPMLARSRGFIKGSVDTAPVLTSSAVPRDSQLFVLNLRPKRLRVDIYNRDGRLQQIYQEPGRPAPDEPDVFPMDFTVYRDHSNRRIFAVLFYKPEPSLRLYTAP